VSAGDVAAVVVAVCMGMGVVGLLLALGAAIRTLADLRDILDDVRVHAGPILAETHAAVRQANARLERVGPILDRADVISAELQSTSSLIYRLLSNPAIKAMALASGGAQAVRTLRKKG
jgi:ABC-type transporter Mla subunit MlaD